MIDQKLLREIIKYDPESGEFFWLPRKPEFYTDSPRRSKEAKAAAWNGRLAGTRAGTSKDVRKYFVIAVLGKLHLAHRLAWLYMTGEWPPHQIDHADLNPFNNRFSNLRCATRSQNQANRKSSRNTSGAKGVSWCKRDRKWLAQIKVKGKQHNLGNYETIEEASAVYKKAAVQHFGDFARID